MKLSSPSAAFMLLLLSPVVSSSAISLLNTTIHDANMASLNITSAKINAIQLNKLGREHMTVQQCLDKNNYWKGDYHTNHPYQILCCAHARAPRHHCEDYGQSDRLDIQLDYGNCEQSPRRYNHGPFCGKLRYHSSDTYDIFSWRLNSYGHVDLLRGYVHDYRKRMHCEQDPLGKWDCLGPTDWEMEHSTKWP